MTRKILIVDDEPNIVMTLEYAFKKQGFEVFIARDGGEALQILESNIPDVVLLDIMMPEVDGYETLKFIKEKSGLEQVKVVFLTAKHKASDIEKGLKLGADKYLTKPFSIKKIISEIQDLLD
ncbi:response regulator [Mangrovimonas sp. AS39]|uniref:response regulator transcription factor n=1 Tax=Mangrovimonas TaxID=1211036 RepID=UPI0006B60DAB|nr:MULTISPECIES: response regulator [Mangrovimonas]MCF1192886.1 response regulator [Mangrovimonas futianensis]MCF1196512.1 response regulator [Mangrovimonas futianensis]MCF1423218.1 response regulator [Mangrovimonas futianensis]NIK93446.1 response regulator [Mangrovimonas sp. CR14]